MPNTSNCPIQVYLVAEPMVLWGLERLVQSAHPRFQVTGTSTSLSNMADLEALETDVVVVDVDGGGDAAISNLFSKCNYAKVLIVTSSRDTTALDKAVLSGVRGIVKKLEPAPSLLKAIECVHHGELWVDRSATSRIFLEISQQKAIEMRDPERLKIATLTSREKQTIAVLTSDAAAAGKVIASRLCISEQTLRNHLTSIYSKLGLANRTALYAYATRHISSMH